MLMRTDPFRELDRLTQQVFGSNGTLARPSAMPMDAWREGDTFHVEFDLLGVKPDRIDLDVERNVVTVKAERPDRASDAELIVRTAPRRVQPPAGPRRQPRHRAHQRQLRRRRAHLEDPGGRAGQALKDLDQQPGSGPARHQRLSGGDADAQGWFRPGELTPHPPGTSSSPSFGRTRSGCVRSSTRSSPPNGPARHRCSQGAVTPRSAHPARLSPAGQPGGRGRRTRSRHPAAGGWARQRSPPGRATPEQER